LEGVAVVDDDSSKRCGRVEDYFDGILDFACKGLNCSD
jgi:hypothetical protein